MRRLPLVLLSLIVAAACGASVAPSTSPPTAAGSAPTGSSGGPARTTVPTAGGVAASSPGRTSLPCGEVMSAWEQTREMLDVLANLSTDEAWAAAQAPDSPITLDPEALDRWIDQLASLPGQSDTVQVMRQVIPLYRAAVRSGKPFSEASQVGIRLLEAAKDAASLAGVEISTALEIRGCTEV